MGNTASLIRRLCGSSGTGDPDESDRRGGDCDARDECGPSEKATPNRATREHHTIPFPVEKGVRKQSAGRRRQDMMTLSVIRPYFPVCPLFLEVSELLASNSGGNFAVHPQNYVGGIMNQTLVHVNSFFKNGEDDLASREFWARTQPR
jgi:hypothetical protein